MEQAAVPCFIATGNYSSPGKTSYYVWEHKSIQQFLSK